MIVAALAWERPTGMASLSRTPVAVRATGNGLLVADYNHLYLFKAGSLNRLTIDNPHSWKWQPTDLDIVGDTVFIANYTGNDVLVGELSPFRNSLRLLRRIGNERTHSPEGIAVKGGKVAVANYDGGNVQIFDAASQYGAIPECDLNVGSWAHGIAFADGYLFVTSLKLRRVLKIDPARCSIVASMGSIGWEAGQFLWPTAIADMGDGRIIVTDAHAGRLTVLDVADLSVKEVWGWNGPKAFNMPYGIEVSDGKIWIASAFNHALVQLDGLTWEGAKFFTYEPNAWRWHRGQFDQKHQLSAATRQGYFARDPIEIRGACYLVGYGEIVRCNGEPAKELKFDRVLRGRNTYFLQATRINGGVLITSPQHRFARYYADNGSDAQEIYVGLDTWSVATGVVSPSGPLDVSAPIECGRRKARSPTQSDDPERYDLSRDRCYRFKVGPDLTPANSSGGS
jgi:hypothetical protein